VHFVVLSQHLPIRPDQHGRIVKDALYPFLGHQSGGDVHAELPGPLGQQVHRRARHPLGQLGEADPTLVTGGGQFGKEDQVHVLFGTDLAHKLFHLHQVVADFRQLRFGLNGGHCDLSHFSSSPYVQPSHH
jgi:hypothetical protein